MAVLSAAPGPYAIQSSGGRNSMVRCAGIGGGGVRMVLMPKGGPARRGKTLIRSLRSPAARASRSPRASTTTA